MKYTTGVSNYLLSANNNMYFKQNSWYVYKFIAFGKCLLHDKFVFRVIGTVRGKSIPCIKFL